MRMKKDLDQEEPIGLASMNGRYPRRRREYGKSQQRVCASTTWIPRDVNKRKKRALQERHTESLIGDDKEFSLDENEKNEIASNMEGSTSSLGRPCNPITRVASVESFQSVQKRRPVHRQYSSSSIYDSVSDIDVENIHPNIQLCDDIQHESPLPPSKVKKIQPIPFNKFQRQRSFENEMHFSSEKNHTHRKAEQRKKIYHNRSSISSSPLGRHSPAFSSTSSASSFSSLAKSNHGSQSWIQKSLESASKSIERNETCFDYNTDTDDNESSNNLSRTTYSKCIVDKDKKIEISNKCINSDCSIYGIPATPERQDPLFERRVRGICKSPVFDVEAINEKECESKLCNITSSSIFKSRESKHRHLKISKALSREDDDESEKASDEGSRDVSISLSTSADSILSCLKTEKTNDDIQLVEPQVKPMRRLLTGKDRDSFFKNVFSPHGIQKLLKSHQVDVKNIPSNEDLAFMIKSLQRRKNSKRVASFGKNQPFVIVTPKHWAPQRKAAFLHWATCELGFSLRSAGGNTSYLQLTSKRGFDLLTSLEEVSKAYEVKKENRNKRSGDHIDYSSTSISKPSINREESNREKAECKALSGPQKQCIDICTSPVSFRSTCFDSSSIKEEHCVNVRVSSLDRNVEIELLNDFDRLTMNGANEDKNDDDAATVDTEILPITYEMEKERSPCLIRTVTIQDEKSIQPISTEHRDDSIEMILNSNDKSIGTKTHDTGMMPSLAIPSNDIRLSISPKDFMLGVKRTSGRLSGEHMSKDLLMHCQGLSPSLHKIRQPSAKMNIPVAKSNVEYISPECADMRMSCCSNLLFPGSGPFFEKAETPIWPNRCAQVWGSRPIKGKDWGASTACESTTISVLLQRLEEDFIQSDSSKHYSPSYIQGEGMNGGISAIVATTTDLGFDFEVDTAHEEGKVSSEEAHRDGYNQIDASDSSGYFEYSTYISKNDSRLTPEKKERKRYSTLAKHRRVSLCKSFHDLNVSFQFSRKSSFGTSARESEVLMEPESNCSARLKTGSPLLRSPVASPSFPKRYFSPKAKWNINVLQECLTDHNILTAIFSFLDENSLLCKTSLVCKEWAEIAAHSHATLSLKCAGLTGLNMDVDTINNTDTCLENEEMKNIHSSVTCSQQYCKEMSALKKMFPYGSYLADGAFKKVYRVWNAFAKAEEALSIMDVRALEASGNLEVVGAEISISILLSSLARRNICPNFVILRSVFNCTEAAPSQWHGRGAHELENDISEVIPNENGMYQYIRMELCKFGDVEGFIRKQHSKTLNPEDGRKMMFQMAFALHTGADKYGLKHYDVKLLNFFLQSAFDESVTKNDHPNVALRYGIGAHNFYIRMSTPNAFVVKLADFGTATVQPGCDGLPVTLAQFTTLENTPPEYLILGDAAKQGYGHDCFGLGLCFLHLFTGYAPYEEILEDVMCPPTLFKNLRRIWESKKPCGYEVIKSVIFSDVYETEDGELEGKDETLYHTLYRYLVLFGIPEEKYMTKDCGKVWRAITSSLTNKGIRNRKACSDASQYNLDCKKYSFALGTNHRIAKARKTLQGMRGGVEVLLSLVSFDPEKRACPLDVINSIFMEPLREVSSNAFRLSDKVTSYMGYSTK